ncbi:hypothetical protein EVAR_95598_1 [Eumeta japonica]|uniref:Uncharacterized protein n=1 Tax=Eumeta variegata TaxID=151549 RepID=A0A4C1VK44_EUMVA|nr:hypothetical protein EVAR_95598_1 [Eumeta japonica]
MADFLEDVSLNQANPALYGDTQIYEANLQGAPYPFTFSKPVCNSKAAPNKDKLLAVCQDTCTITQLFDILNYLSRRRCSDERRGRSPRAASKQQVPQRDSANLISVFGRARRYRMGEDRSGEDYEMEKAYV